jgi:xanthine/uracil/vitamin C permease (AzgA family)
VNRLDRFFEVTARGSTVGAEIRGGVVTFIAMAYIIVLNPIILSGSADVAGNKLQFAQVSATTALAAGVMTILFGLFARLPFAFAAGLGINSFLATTVVGTLTWPEAMGLVVINGLIIVVLAVTGLRRLVFDAVPMQLKLAITAGIGLFILFIGLVDSGFIQSTGLPSPPVGLGSGGHGSINTVPTLVFIFTLLITGILVVRKVRGGILIGLVMGTLVAMAIEAIWHLGSAANNPGGWSLSVPTLSGAPFALPDLSLVGAFSFESFSRIGILAATMLVFTLVFANFFDAMGTFTGLSREAGVADDRGYFPRLRSALIVEGRRRGRRRRHLGVVEHGVHRVRRRHRGGCPHRSGQHGDRRAVLDRDVRLAAGLDRAQRGRRRRAGHRGHDDVLPAAPHRPLRVLGGAAGRVDRRGDAVQLFDRQRHRGRLRHLGGGAFGGRQGARDKPAAVDRGGRLRRVLRARLDRVGDRVLTQCGWTSWMSTATSVGSGSGRLAGPRG